MKVRTDPKTLKRAVIFTPSEERRFLRVADELDTAASRPGVKGTEAAKAYEAVSIRLMEIVEGQRTAKKGAKA